MTHDERPDTQRNTQRDADRDPQPQTETMTPRLELPHREHSIALPDTADDWTASAPGVRPAAATLPAYELAGPPGAPVVVTLGGISASRHVAASDVDPAPGWWEGVAGPGLAIDFERWRVLGFDYVDGGRGADGRPTRTVTTHDQADALVAVLDAVGIEKLHAIVGASYGGMVALAFAERYPERVDRIVSISAPDRPHPMSTGLRAIQRRVVKLGLETGRGRDALVLARALGMTTYRSAREFAERFETAPTSVSGGDATFDVEGYLLHSGEKFAARWRPERFLALSLSGDLHRVDPRRITTPTLLVAAEGDTLVPLEQLEALAATLAAPVRLELLATRYGHDAFLLEPDRIGPIIHTALTSPKFP